VRRPGPPDHRRKGSWLVGQEPEKPGRCARRTPPHPDVILPAQATSQEGPGLRKRSAFRSSLDPTSDGLALANSVVSLAVKKTVSSLPALGAALGMRATAREVKLHEQISAGRLMTGTVNWLNSRGSTRLGGSGLLVLALGAMALLSGLSNPEPASHDLVKAAVTMAPAGRSMPSWTGGMAMIGVALIVIGVAGAPRRSSSAQPQRFERPASVL